MRRILLFIGTFLLLFSAIFLFQIMRELVVDWKINNKFQVKHAYVEEGFPSHIDVHNIEINGHDIEIVEEETGRKGRLTFWDKEEGVKAGDIVKLHLLVNDEKVTTADEIWLSNRNRGSRYFSWLDILTVDNQVAIVQRLTDDMEDMEEREWKIVWIDEKGKINEEKITYEKRKQNPLAVRLINESGTSLSSMGYYSDIVEGYPSTFFPLIYPIGTGIFGVFLCLYAFLIKRRRS